MPAHIGIVVNPHARRASAAALPGRLGASCAAVSARGAVKTTLLVTRDESELPAAVGQLQAAGVDVLAVCGGDGTLLSTISAAIESYAGGNAALPPLLILPGGTMNTVARNLGIGDAPAPEAVLQRLCATLAEAGPRGLSLVPRFGQPVMRVTTEGEGSPLAGTDAGPGGETYSVSTRSRTRYGCIFSAAMGARFLAEYSRRPGLPWALLLGLRTIGSSLIPGGGRFARWLFQRTAAELSIDGRRAAEAAFRLLLCATVPDVGLGMRVPWRAGFVPRRFQVVASSLPLYRNALQLLRIQRGQPMRGQPHTDELAREVSVRFFEPQPLTLDGEVFSATAVKVSLGPTLEVLLP